MLSPTTRTVLGETARAMRRRRATLHLTVAETQTELLRAAGELGRLDADIAAVTADLARDDQARADAGDDLPTEDHVPFSATLAEAAACRICSADGTKTEG